MIKLNAKARIALGQIALLAAVCAQWLKGAGGTLGFDTFTEPAKALEACATNGDREAIPTLLATLNNMCRRTQHAAHPATTVTETTARSMSVG